MDWDFPGSRANDVTSQKIPRGYLPQALVLTSFRTQGAAARAWNGVVSSPLCHQGDGSDSVDSGSPEKKRWR